MAVKLSTPSPVPFCRMTELGAFPADSWLCWSPQSTTYPSRECHFRNTQWSGVIQQLYHHGLCTGWTKTSPSEACKLMASRSREERCCLMLRERAAPSCAHVYLLHCKLRALLLLISTKYSLAISLLGLFHCIPLQAVFAGMELSCYSSKSSQPAWFLRGISCLSVSQLLPARGILRCRWGRHIIRPPKPGAEGAAARGCRAEAASACAGKGEGVQDNPLLLQVSPAQAATSWAPTGTGFFLEIVIPKCKELITVNILHWWSKETTTLRVPGLRKLQKCRDDKVVQLLTWLVG